MTIPHIAESITITTSPCGAHVWLDGEPRLGSGQTALDAIDDAMRELHGALDELHRRRVAIVQEATR